MKFYSSAETPQYPRANHLYTLDTESFSIDVDPIDRKRYRATAEVAALGPLTVARVESNAAIVTRKGERPADDESRRYTFVFVTEGEMIISHHLGKTELREGDFVLLDNNRNRTMFVYNNVTLLLVSVTARLLRKYIPRPDDVTGLKPPRDARDNAFLLESLFGLWQQLKQGRVQEFCDSLSDDLLKGAAQAFSNGGGKITRCARRMAQVKELIEEDLSNPELTVEMLAARMNISSRYLRALFSGTERVSHYILRRRLEECARQLSNPLYRNVSITSIAFQWGFNSPAHFSRSFRLKYGMTPREYRRQHI